MRVFKETEAGPEISGPVPETLFVDDRGAAQHVVTAGGDNAVAAGALSVGFSGQLFPCC